jgi:hypothetical protein
MMDETWDGSFPWCYDCKSYHHPKNPTCVAVYNVDTLRAKLARKYNPVVAVEVHDHTTYVQPVVEFMPMTVAIERFDPFQSRS